MPVFLDVIPVLKVELSEIKKKLRTFSQQMTGTKMGPGNCIIVYGTLNPNNNNS